MDPNKVFFDTVGGFRKGEVYGLGKAGASLYYEKSSGRAGPSYSAISAKLDEMSARFEASERARVELELRAAERDRLRDEEQRRQAEYIEQMKAQMDAFMRQFGNPSSFPRCPDDRTDGSALLEHS